MYDDLIAVIKNANTFLITAHVNPEGDSIGSVFAMNYLLRILGKKTVIVCHDRIPNGFDFLGLSWVQYNQLKEAPAFEWAVILDSPSVERIGDVGKLLSETSKIINIDHHISNQYFGACNVVDPQASSCGEMVYGLFKQMNVPLSKDVAALLYMAIATDTGSFRYTNTSAYTHHVIADLMKTGIDLSRLNEQLYANVSFEKIKLLERFLHNIHFSPDKTIAWSFLTRDDCASVGAQPEDSEGFINVLRDIKGTRIAFFAFEVKNNSLIKFSLRSKGNCDVNKVAHCFKGGGHPKAAGCTVTDTLNGAIEQVLHKAQEHIDDVEKHDE